MPTVRSCAWILLSLAWLWAPAAVASAGVDAYLRATNVLYQGLDYEKALVQLQRAKVASRDVQDDLRIALWEGIVFADLGKAAESREAFNTALALDGQAQLPIKVSPKVAEQFERLRLEVKKRLAHSDVPKVEAPSATLVPTAAPTPAPVSEQPVAALEETPVYQRWWFWTAIGVVVAGGVTAAVVVATRPAPGQPPMSDFPPIGSH